MGIFPLCWRYHNPHTASKKNIVKFELWYLFNIGGSLSRQIYAYKEKDERDKRKNLGLEISQ
jgi:hypothetical protein